MGYSTGGESDQSVDSSGFCHLDMTFGTLAEVVLGTTKLAMIQLGTMQWKRGIRLCDQFTYQVIYNE